MLKMQYARTELSYNADFLHSGRLWQKQQIGTVISSGLINSLVSREGWIFLQIARGISKTLVSVGG